jgi:predicted dehydrogenase
MNTVRIGVVGCGNISDTYFRNLPKFGGLAVTACADLDPARAAGKAAQYGLRALSVEALLADPEIDLVVNLTVPQAHAPLNLQALAAGKHVYTEKPLAVTREDGRATLALAKAKGLRVGSAPDTVLGGGTQTARQLVDAGAIGLPVGFTAFMGSGGPEAFHPDPDFFFQPGAGPLFDIGPYYLSALITLFGPVTRVTSIARVTRAERLITSQPRYGQTITVNTPTHVNCTLEFASGPVGVMIMSWDVGVHRQPNLDLFGTAATLAARDPNQFGGPVLLRPVDAPDWQDVPLTHGYADNLRGLGVAEMAAAIRENRPHRASGELAYHVLDLLHCFIEANATGRHVTPESTCARPEAMPVGEGLLAKS